MKKLGFGLMRLPMNGGKIDIEMCIRDRIHILDNWKMPGLLQVLKH